MEAYEPPQVFPCSLPERPRGATPQRGGGTFFLLQRLRSRGASDRWRIMGVSKGVKREVAGGRKGKKGVESPRPGHILSEALKGSYGNCSRPHLGPRIPSNLY
jgi:hypothetical protein